jgi:hypothetical protein
MAFKGIRTYTGDELGNILLGQSGFIIVPASKRLYLDNGIPYISNHDGSSALVALRDPDNRHKVNQFPIIRVVDAGTFAANVEFGDSFSTTGVTVTNANFSSIDLTVELADTYYGAFNEVFAGSGTILQVHLG